MKKYVIGLLAVLLFTSASNVLPQVRTTAPAAPWPYTPSDWKDIHAEDNIRFKVFNSAGCVNTAQSCESEQIGIRIRFRRRASPNTEVIATKIMTLENDRSTLGGASGGNGSWAFGAAALRGRSVTDADSPNAGNINISSCTLGNPTTVTLSGGHGWTTGRIVAVNVTGAVCSPSIAGPWLATVTGATTFTVATTTTGSTGAVGSIYSSTTLTSATAAFTSGDVGKEITLSVGGVVCTTDSPCQGPKFPSNITGVTYMGTITAFTDSSTVTVKPSILVDPAAAGTLVIEPTLKGDGTSTELGDGWLTAVDVNFWGTGQRVGQTYVEGEINNGPFNMHEGWSLFCDYVETSGHLSWPGSRVCRHKVGDVHGWTRTIVFGTTGGSATFADPAAGTEWTATVPLNAHWKILSVRAVYTCSTTVINRQAAIVIDDGSNVFYPVMFPGSMAASAVHTLTAAPGIDTRSIQNVTGSWNQYAALPQPIELMAGWRIRSSTASIQAGDDYSAIVIEVEETIEEAGG